MASLVASTAMVDAVVMMHLTQHDTVVIDKQLMGPIGFSVDQLMVMGYDSHLEGGGGE
jgi:pyridoxal 5'-phosphate synthase / NAD(P)H-hydrate epimerase